MQKILKEVNFERRFMYMKKIIALLAALALLLCSCAFAEGDAQPAEVQTGEYNIINSTGENITELKITDNVTGETIACIDPEHPETGVLFADSTMSTTFEIPASENGEHRLTLTFKTESGREESFGTLSIEEVTIELLAADAMTGATPIAFSMPKKGKVGSYTFVNKTGQVIAFLNLINNQDGTATRISFINENTPFAPGETKDISFGDSSDAEEPTITLQFVTVDGDIYIFNTLKFEDVKVNLLGTGTDAVSGATPVSFEAR